MTWYVKTNIRRMIIKETNSWLDLILIQHKKKDLKIMKGKRSKKSSESFKRFMNLPTV